MKNHTKDYREAYGSFMAVLGPVVDRAMAVTPDLTEVSSEECDAFREAGNALLREVSKERAAEKKLRLLE